MNSDLKKQPEARENASNVWIILSMQPPEGAGICIRTIFCKGACTLHECGYFPFQFYCWIL